MTGDFVFCPRCSAPLADLFLYGRQRRACRYCHYVQFRDPKVAVAALICDGSKIVLVRRAVAPNAGRWALPAGYMDHDERPEEAVVREAYEETGLRVEVLGLTGVVPLDGWKEQRGILLVYRARAVAGQIEANDDATDAQWFCADQVPWRDIAFASTEQLLLDWMASLPAAGPEAS